MSLYNKYRPQTFAQMKGNFSHLGKMLDRPDHNHVFLLTGGVGRGKTTAARIIASMVGAEDISRYEINCADYNGVDDARALIREMGLTSFSKSRVYILDEFHKMTTPAQNALLKYCEDTPKDTYIIMCSSEPRTIIPGLKSRACVIDFPPLTSDELYDILREVKIAEKLQVSKDILFDIADLSNGSAREALTTLELVSSAPPDEQEALLVARDSEENKEIIDLCRAYYGEGNTWKELRTVLTSLKEQKMEPETIRRALLGYGSALLLGNSNSDSIAFRMERLCNNTFDSGFPGLVNMIYLSWAAAQRGF